MTRKNKIIIIITSFVALLLIVALTLFLLLDVIVWDYNFNLQRNSDAIHFVNTGRSDCIIIASKGEYAIVDCGYGGKWVSEGEQPSINLLQDYLRKLTKGKDVTFKYAIATHTHRDHMSGFLDLFSLDFVSCQRFYAKAYNDTGNKPLYNQVMDLLEEKSIPVNHDVENLELEVGNFRLSILNGQLDAPTEDGDNDNSLAILVTHGKTKTLLAGDLTNINGDEERLAPQIGDVDVLKVGHHAHYRSTSAPFMETIQPEIAVVTNGEFTSQTVRDRLIKYCDDKVFSTVNDNGIVITYGIWRTTVYKNSCDFH